MTRHYSIWNLPSWAIFAVLLPSSSCCSPAQETFRVGAYAINVNPVQPAHIAGDFLDRVSNAILDNLYSRCIVIDDGRERVAIVVVDNTELPGDLIDKIERVASSKTGIRRDHMLIAATHNHSSPSTLDYDGGPADNAYIQLLLEKIPEGIELATQNLKPARVGTTVVRDWEHTHTREWIRRPDKIDLDPFGRRTVRSNMHPGFQNPDVIGPAGPSDPDISIISFQTLAGEPIALLADYAQHYYGVPSLVDGSPLISADYFGAFADSLRELIDTSAATSDQGFNSSSFDDDAVRKSANRAPTTREAPAFVAIMAQGTSGDQQWMDYNLPAPIPEPAAYADAVAREVFKAYKGISYQNWVPVLEAQTMLTLGIQRPSEQDLLRSQAIVAKMNGQPPSSIVESYALRTIQMSELPPKEDLKLQAMRIGEFGLTAIPLEVFAITGLKIKAQSPFKTTANVTLANGYGGYLSPPDRLNLGGYTTWLPRYERDAEPKIVEATLALLEKLAGRRRHSLDDPSTPYSKAILRSKPLAYWRLNEFNGPTALDASGHHHDATYDGSIAFYLPGPDLSVISEDDTIDHSAHLAGGRLEARLPLSLGQYSVEFCFWNGLPRDLRGITGWLASIGIGDRLGIGGRDGPLGRLIFVSDNKPPAIGHSIITEKTWNHVAIVRNGPTLDIYLNGRQTPEITTSFEPLPDMPVQSESLLLGGSPDSANGLEGRLGEVAVYDHVLSPLEIFDHYRLLKAHASQQ